jgi:hypothetical protein
MGKLVRKIELRNSEGQLILSFHLVESEMSTAGGSENASGRKQEPRKGNNQGNGQGNPEFMTEAQRRYLFRILADQGIEGDAAFDRLKSLFDVSVLKDVTKRDASKMIEQLLADQGGAGDGPPF